MPKKTESPDALSRTIRYLIVKLGGITKASDATNISGAQLSNYQTGKDKPGAENLQKLARAGGVTVDWILGLDVEVADADSNAGAENYPPLNPKEMRLLEEIQELLKLEDEIAYRHLRRQVEMIKAWVMERQKRKK